MAPQPRRLEPAMTHLPHAGDPRNGNPPNRPARMTADHKASATTVQQRCPPLPANVPSNPPHDGANPAKPRQNPAIPPISRTPPIEHVVGADPSTVLDRWSSLMAPSSMMPSLYRVLAGTWAEMMLPAGGGIKPFLRSHHRPAWRPGNFGVTSQATEAPATHPNDIRSPAPARTHRTPAPTPR